MRVIHKHVLPPGHSPIVLPVAYTVRHVAFQGDDLCLWEEHEAGLPTLVRSVIVIPTGAEFHPHPLTFAGTAVHPTERLVFHVYLGHT